ncbi:MAG: DUF86 domain-containing protein [Fimbriimonadales bacterium]
MRRDPGLWLEDILTHGRDAIEFLEGMTQERYVADKGLRAMVERKLFIVGEAVAQLRNSAPEVANRLPDVHEIVGFRNILTHGYFALDHRRVYDIASSSLPGLVREVEELIKEF